MKRTKQIWVCVLAWLFGLGLATQFATRFSQLLWVWLVLSLAIVLYFVKSWVGYIALCVIFLCAGLLRGQMTFVNPGKSDARSYIGQKHELLGVVQGTPFWNDDKLYEFYLQDVRLDGQKISGLVKVKTLSSGIFEGQTVRVQGKLGRALGRANAQVWYAEVTTVNAIPSLPVRIKRTMQHGLERSLSPTAASFASGLLFGGSSQLPDAVRQATQQTGLTHIVAVSGFNLTIIMALVLTFLCGRLRLKTIVPVLALVGFYVLMTGATSSVLRAAVMTTLVLIVGTQNKKLSVGVALAATILAMTAWSPAFFYSDLSWQLSVLALAGVVFLSPVFIPKNPSKFQLLWEIFAVSLAAHLATAPLIAHVFGSFSLVAPLANVVILPFIPLAMFVSFLVAACSALALPFSGSIAFGVNTFLMSILQTIQALARVPNASMNITVSSFAMWVSFVGLGVFMLFGARRASKKPLQQV